MPTPRIGAAGSDRPTHADNGGVTTDRVEDPRERRALIAEMAIVGALTFGLKGLRAILELIEAQLAAGLSGTVVALNPATSRFPVIDALQQTLRVGELLAMGALGAYLLWRGGLKLSSVGLGRPRGRDVLPGVGLAALIGIPGLALVAAASAFGFNAQLVPASGDPTWWQLILLCLISVGNAVAEEVLVVAYFMTRLRQVGVSATGALLSSALLRGSYHLYQGLGGGLGNVVMGLVFGRWFQKTGRVWPLVVAHALIDIVAFVGYALLSDHLGWLGL